MRQSERISTAIFLDSVSIEGDGDIVRYSYGAFADTLKRHDVCYDRRTIRNWWSVMVAKGIIEELGDPYDKALFHVPVWNLNFPDKRISPDAHTHAHTRTHTIPEGTE